VTLRDVTGRSQDESSAEVLAAVVADPVGPSSRLPSRSALRRLALFYNSNNLTFASSITAHLAVDLPVPAAHAGGDRAVAVSDGAVAESAEPRGVSGSEPLRFRGQLEQLSRRRCGSAPRALLLTLWASMGVFGAITSAVNLFLRGAERNSVSGSTSSWRS
jgi:hypothetical protein